MSDIVKLAISTNVLALLNDNDTIRHILIRGNDYSTVIISGTVDNMQKVIIACENAVTTRSRAEIVFRNKNNGIILFEPQYDKNTNLTTTKI